jgi:hypothetical protein
LPNHNLAPLQVELVLAVALLVPLVALAQPVPVQLQLVRPQQV